jgi:hypothetical protein
VTTIEAGHGRERAVNLVVHLDPPNAADDADWFLITAWQGEEGRSVVSPLKKIEPGTWKSQEPLPVHGSWKATLRLAKGRAVQGVAVYFPEDTAIPAKGVPATRQFTRPFVVDKKLLQREQKPGVSPALQTVGYLIVLLIAIVLIGSLVAGLRRLDRLTSQLRQPEVEKELLASA